MESYRQKNLKVYIPSMGQLVIQPVLADEDDISKAKLVIYPFRVPNDRTDVVVEWAASSQTPIFCHAADISKLELEGFGAYRFHKLDGYREIDFQGVSFEFFPARRPKAGGIKEACIELLELFNAVRPFAFHLLIRPVGERPILFLASPEIDQTDWAVLTRSQPASILGAEEFSRESWNELSQKFQAKITYAGDVECIQSAPMPERAVLAEKAAVPVATVATKSSPAARGKNSSKSRSKSKSKKEDSAWKATNKRQNKEAADKQREES